MKFFECLCKRLLAVFASATKCNRRPTNVTGRDSSFATSFPFSFSAVYVRPHKAQACQSLVSSSSETVTLLRDLSSKVIARSVGNCLVEVEKLLVSLISCSDEAKNLQCRST